MEDPVIVYVDKEGKTRELEVDEEETTLDMSRKGVTSIDLETVVTIPELKKDKMRSKN